MIKFDKSTTKELENNIKYTHMFYRYISAVYNMSCIYINVISNSIYIFYYKCYLAFKTCIIAIIVIIMH